MSNINNEVVTALAELENKSTDELFEELGARQQAVDVNPALLNELMPDIGIPQGAREDLGLFGRKVWEHFNVAAFKLVCGTDQKHEEERKKVLDSITMGQGAVTAALTAGLVTVVGAVFAPVVALLVFNLIIEPAGQAVCDVWKTHLPQASSSPDATA